MATSAVTSKITQLRIEGFRVIDSLELDVRGLTVLIGDNGTGKSTILEALELLRQTVAPSSFERDVLDGKHGGLRAMLRRGASKLSLECRVRTPHHELIHKTEAVLKGDRASAMHSFQVDGDSSAAKSYGPGLGLEGMVDELDGALRAIDVHVPFETRPLWQQRELDIRTSPRLPCAVEPAERLSRYGINLVNAFLELKNRGNGAWERVLDRCRLGIRDDLRDFVTTPARRGELELQVVFGGDPDHPMPIEYLSEGQLAYLAMVALCGLSDRSSIVAFDEPEVHLHPGLLARVVGMLEELAQTTPVLLCTHSDRLLDCLSDPAASVVLCDLDERGATRLRRPDRAELTRWLEEYRGFGSLRAEGYSPHVFDKADPT